MSSISYSERRFHQLVTRSFTCAVILFCINMFFALTKLVPLLVMTAIILPGFVYGHVLAYTTKGDPDRQSSVFVFLSGGLYILISWIATGDSPLGDNIYILFPVAGVIGAVLLLLLYRTFLDRGVSLYKGIRYCFLTGLISSVLPVLVHWVDIEYRYDFINQASLLSVFLIWQPLFGFTIIRSRKLI
jgi:hypothetical protein